MEIHQMRLSGSEKPFEAHVRVTKRYIKEQLGCDRKLERRLNRVGNRCADYFASQKYDTRKAFITITYWGLLLYRNRGVVVERKGDIYQLWREFYKTIVHDGIRMVPNFQSIFDSAVKQVGKVHLIAQEEGYF